MLAAAFLVYVLARVPQHAQAADGSALLRDAGLVLLSANLIVQAVRERWPARYALPLTVGGISLWLAGWLPF